MAAHEQGTHKQAAHEKTTIKQAAILKAAKKKAAHEGRPNLAAQETV